MTKLIKDLQIRSHHRNALIKGSITTVDQFSAADPLRLLGIPGVGLKCVRETREAIAEGLYWQPGEEEARQKRLAKRLCS